VTTVVNPESRLPPLVTVTNCTGKQTVFNVVSGKTYLLKIINVAGLAFFNFAIAGHKLTVVAQDGTDLKPFEVSSIDLPSANRYGVLLKADQPPMKYKVQVQTDYDSYKFEHSDVGTAILSYGETASVSSIVPPNESRPPYVWNDLLHSLEPSTVPSKSDRTVYLTTRTRKVDPITLFPTNNTDSIHAYTIVGVVATNLPSTPYLIASYAQRPDLYSAKASEPIRIEKGQVVDIIVQSIAEVLTPDSGFCSFHPVHLHGQDFWLIGQGAFLVHTFKLEPSFSVLLFHNALLYVIKVPESLIQLRIH
jgi:FtsP/CotA-like multicopper oxidase with cupredoxin domain